MKKTGVLSVVFLLTSFLAGCEPQNLPGMNHGGESGGTETPGKDNPGGDKPSGDANKAQYDVFKAFDKVGNYYCYRMESASSYVRYGSGTVSSSDVYCDIWEVQSVSGNTATVYVYRDYDFNKPTTLTFSRDGNGGLMLGNQLVTNTTSPYFYGMSVNKTSSTTCTESYSNGVYTNHFNTNSNGYTSSTWQSIDEKWGNMGLLYSYYESTSDDATVGSYQKVYDMIYGQNNYGTYSCNGYKKPETPVVTDLDGTVNADGTGTLTITFTHRAAKADTWAYELGFLADDDNWYRASRFGDNLSSLFRNVRMKVVNPSASTTHKMTVTLTKDAINLGYSWGFLPIRLCALGYDYESDMSSQWDLTFSNESGTPARIVARPAGNMVGRVVPAAKVFSNTNMKQHKSSL